MQKPRKIPQRQCVGCREMKEKKALLRIVRTPEGEVLSDATGKKYGRGAWLLAHLHAARLQGETQHGENVFRHRPPSICASSAS